MNMTKKLSLWVLIIGYLVAGTNHFRNPASYINIIPAYIPYPVVTNVLSGAAEVLLALLLISPKTRHYAAWGIIAMLIAFLPVHIDMIINAPMQLGSITVTPILAWLRILFQPVLILWAWWYTKPYHTPKSNCRCNKIWIIQSIKV